MNIYNAKILPDDVIIWKVRSAARIYQQYVDKDILLVFAKSRKGPFYTYQFHAGKENFQHLAGVKYPKGANRFFDRCLDDKNILKRNEIVPAEHIKTTSSKINVLPEILNLKNAKVYKCGERDLVTMKNRFSMAIGNKQGIMGFDKRSYYLPVPVTVMNRSIYEFCSVVSNIFLIMVKSEKDDKYSDIFYEITEDILHKAAFGCNIRKMIDTGLSEGRILAEVAVTSEGK